MVSNVNLDNSMHSVILYYKRDYCVVMYRNYICVMCGREEIRTPKGLSPAQLATETASP